MVLTLIIRVMPVKENIIACNLIDPVDHNNAKMQALVVEDRLSKDIMVALRLQQLRIIARHAFNVDLRRINLV